MQRLGLRLCSARAPSAAPSLGLRRLHKRQSLPYSVEGGLGKFLPPDALEVQVEWQDGLLERLNEQVAHTGEASSTIIQTIINLAGNKSKILAFNYASLALNNSFFLDNLKPPSPESSTHEHEIASHLMQNIRVNHGGIEQLRSTFSAAALGTFSSGWVWFVSDQTGKTSTTTTYGPSTLLIRSRTDMRRDPTPDNDPRLPTAPPPFIPPGSLPSESLSPSRLPDGDMPLASSSATLDSSGSFMSIASSIYNDSFPTRAPRSNPSETGEFLYPLFCLPVYEHTWMSAGYGVWGKEQWLKEFWTVLDWKKVNLVYEDIKQSASYS